MLKLSDKVVNSLFKSKLLNFIPKRVIKRLIKKNKIFFIQTSLKNLPSNNYPFLLSLEDLDKKKDIYSNNETKIPTNEFPYLSLILKLIFYEKEKFRFLDFGAQYIDNYFFLKNKNRNIEYYYHDLVENNKIVQEFVNFNNLENIEVLYRLEDICKKEYDFIYFGSVIQYVNEFKKLLQEILKKKPKYIYFSGLNIYQKNKNNFIICKQFNVFPQMNYCYFFKFDYLVDLICSKNYDLLYCSENPNSKINYSHINSHLNENCQYLDLFFKINN